MYRRGFAKASDAVGDIVLAGNESFGRVSTPDLLPIRKNGLWGYIDLTGNLVINPQFVSAGYFADGLAAVLTNSSAKYGFVDRAGKLAVPPHFDQAGSPFSEGLADVEVNNKWGFVDKSGTPAVAFKYDRVQPFSEGLASVTLGGKAGFTDNGGNEVIPLQYDRAGSFTEGTASVSVKGQSIYINRLGKQVIAGGFAQAGPFSEGRAWFQQVTGQLLGYIDKFGKVIVAPRFDLAFPFSEGVALVHTGGANGDWFYIDDSGHAAFNAKFKRVEDVGSEFSEGLAGIAPKDKFGYIDKTGKLVIDAQFQNVGSFSSGVASAQVTPPARGYIDFTGNFIWPPTW